MAYFVPARIILTEGEKKTLSLWGLGWQGLGEAAERPRWLPVGLSGTWNFRGTIGKPPTVAAIDAMFRAADVWHFKWPANVPIAVNGIDDLVGAWGSESVLNLLKIQDVLAK